MNDVIMPAVYHSSRMTLTLSGPNRLQEQLKRDSGFLHQFNIEAEKQLNFQLQRHGVAAVTDKAASET